MLGHIVVKELRLNLVSWRFLVGLVVVAGLMGLAGHVLVQDYAARRQDYLSNLTRYQRELENTKVYSTLAVKVALPPSPLTVFARPSDSRSTTITVSPWKVPALIGDYADVGYSIEPRSARTRPENPLLRKFTPIDLTFVIGTVLSLLAALLVFDSVSGEHERGTLALLLSNPVGRFQLLVGKLLGALLTIAIPLTLGFVEIAVLWTVSGLVTLDPSLWLGTLAIYVVSLTFLAGALALGLLVSLLSRESSSSMMHLLVVWVLLVVVIPESGGALAQALLPWPALDIARDRIKRVSYRFFEEESAIKYEQIGPWYWASTNSEGQEEFLGITAAEVENRRQYNLKVVPLKLRFAEQKYQAAEQAEAALLRWWRFRQWLASASLSALYQHTVAAIAGTDLENDAQLLAGARHYRQTLLDYLKPKARTPEWFSRALEHPEMQPTPANVRLWEALRSQAGHDALDKILTWDKVAPLDLREMPPPRVWTPGLSTRLARCAGSFLLLLGAPALFLALAAVRVVRYPVYREASMLWTIIKREMSEHLRSLRFSAVLVMALALAVLGALVFSAQYHRNADAIRPCAAENVAEDSGVSGLQGLPCQAGIAVDRRPSPLAFISLAGEADLPNRIRMAVHGIQSVGLRAGLGSSLSGPQRLDWSFVIAVVLSFGAGLLACRALSSERRDGTLALVLAHAVPRVVVLVGKYLAALLLMAAASLTAAIAGLLVLTVRESVEWTPDSIGKLAFFFCCSLAYLSLFVLIGLLCSAGASGPLVSTVAFLFAWTGMVFIVPSLGGLLAQQLGRAPTPKEMDERLRSLRESLVLSGDMNAKQSAEAALQRELAKERVVIEYVQALVRQVQFGETLTRVSPTSVFTLASERLVGSGTGRLLRFTRNAVNFRERLFAAILAADKADPESQHIYRPWWCGHTNFSKRRVNLGDARFFNDAPATAYEGLNAALFDLALLFSYNGVVFLLVLWRFERQDVTPAPGE